MKKFILAALICVLGTECFAQFFFSGNAGFRLDASFYDETKQKNTAQLKTAGFFSGQAIFSENLFLRSELSIATDNLFSKSIFTETPATFRLDELSLIVRNRFISTTNYFSLFAGNFEPLGSDVFLQRYFSAEPIASKITDSWLGTGNSTIFNSFGLGIGDVIKSEKHPIAFSVSLLFNREPYHNDDVAMMLPLRLALAYRYFTFDFMFAIAAPFEKDPNSFVKINTVYARSGMTMLFGNNYTPFSLLLQAGITFISLTRPGPQIDIASDALYFIFEPRIKIRNNHINLTVYDIPQDTARRFYAVRDTFGANILYYNDSVYAGSKKFTFGVNITASFPNTTFLELILLGQLHGLTAYVSPYMETDLTFGRIKFAIDIEPVKLEADNYGNMSFRTSKVGEALRLKLGYSAKF